MCKTIISNFWKLVYYIHMKISFFGAAQNVTGSKHLIESGGYKLLLDCGLHQGRRSEVAPLNKQLPFEAKSIDSVILSHAHADHCGMLPVLVKEGFKGDIFATTATADIAEYIMLDSAKIQEMDAIAYNDRLPINADPIAPIYTEEDAKKVPAYFNPVPYFRLKPHWTNITEKIKFKFYDAGHILGSAISVTEFEENGKIFRVGFTGDMGNPGAPLLREPELIREELDVLLMEATYGNQNHRSIEEACAELEHIIKEAFAKKSKIVVPAFALGRTQELIYLLHKMTDEGRIPRIPIYIDSPLALNIGEVIKAHPEDYDEETWQDFDKKDGETPLAFRNLNYVHTVEESKALNFKEGPFMVISASGMCEGGRIIHHLKNNIEDPRATILLTGYQAQNTLGRKLHHGISPVNISGRQYNVKAKIVTINELSAHADQSALLSYLKAMPLPKKLVLVHTEPEHAESFKKLVSEQFPNLPIIIPAMGDVLEI